MSSFYLICLAHEGHIGTDRCLLIGQCATPLRQIAKDLLNAVSHMHDNTWHIAFDKPVGGTGHAHVASN